MASLWQMFKNSSIIIKLLVVAVIVVWTAALTAVGALFFLAAERPVVAQLPTPGLVVTNPTISLEPGAGPVDTPVTISGQDWLPGSTVLVYLAPAYGGETNDYAISSAGVDSTGRFQVTVPVIANPAWQIPGLVRVVVRTSDTQAGAEAFFSLLDVAEEPAETETATPEPTAAPVEPTATPEPTITPEPTATPVPGAPSLQTLTDLNIRSGPGTGYTLLGLLKAGQTAEITGVSADGRWWQINFSGTASGRGWVAAQYVTTQNATNVPLVQAPALPVQQPTATPQPTATSQPTATPVVISDWRGEYYNNATMSGNPVLVRNDRDINFDWGASAAAVGLPADNFSVRWSRTLYFSAGTYRFTVRADDGVLLWVDDNLLVDQWRDSSATIYTADANLTNGLHTVKMAYYDRTGDAVAQLRWDRMSVFPDWKGEYFDNRKLDGSPVVVRNDRKIDFDWGRNAPAAGIDNDNFSVRWTRKADFDEGTYLVQVRVDDGVRLWLDDKLVIDSWQDGRVRTLEARTRVSEGRHKVKVEYYERSGDAEIEVKWQKQNEPANQLPLAVLDRSSYTVNEDGQLTFDGRGSSDPDGSISKFEWDFNYSGSAFNVQASGPAVTNAYPDGPASSVIGLRVTDNNGASRIAVAPVTVQNVAPAAEAGGPYAGLVNATITLAGTATDPSAVDQAGLVYRWDFGDGGQGNGPIVSHSYASAGSYTVRLTVTDKDGGQGSDTATVVISAANQPPQAVINGASQGLVGATLSFDGSESTDSDGSIASYAWSFGDGTTAAGANVSHAFDAAGSYKVTLTVTDDGGQSANASLIVRIDAPVPVNQPPQAVINGASQGLVGESLSFDGSRSRDSDGSIVSYAWDFGDGTTGSGASVSHSYAVDGSYKVSLTVTDDGGLTASVAHLVQVDMPVSVNLPPQATLSGPTSGQVNEILSFSAAGSADQDGQLVSYVWDFGDGTTASGVDVSHAYAASGSYKVSLTVTDDGGLTANAGQVVQINDSQPVAGSDEVRPSLDE